MRISSGKARVLICAPLHWRTHAVAVAEIDIIAHPDLIPVVQYRASGHRKEDRVNQLKLTSVVAQERSKPPANTKIEASAGSAGGNAIHVVALFFRHHLKDYLIVIAEENLPLA